jgi:hypothetical protein
LMMSTNFSVPGRLPNAAPSVVPVYFMAG